MVLMAFAASFVASFKYIILSSCRRCCSVFSSATFAASRCSAAAAACRAPSSSMLMWCEFMASVS